MRIATTMMDDAGQFFVNRAEDPMDELAPEGHARTTHRRPVVTLYVLRSRQQWVVRDIEGNFWIVPPGEDGWDRREPFEATEETDLEPVPGHYKIMIGLPV